MNNNTYRIGIDAGSTTLKLVVLNDLSEIIYKSYVRHKADVRATLLAELEALKAKLGEAKFTICLTGSAGMGIAERLKLPFIQEVVASVELLRKKFSGIKTLLDLGGEDAKMVFFEENRQPDIRMNGSCAGGTGAFIDQMASLMNISLEKFADAALQYEKIYPIASRCGVFAKTDIQNLISKNVPTEDVAASTLYAVAMQNITSLARGCDTKPPMLCVGGPLTFIPALRKSFAKVLNLEESDLIIPENSQYFPAWGAALHEVEVCEGGFDSLLNTLLKNENRMTDTLPALFEGEEHYHTWKAKRKIKQLKPITPKAGEMLECFLGIDSGSTTTKIVAIDKESNIVFHYYSVNEGNSLKKVIEGLQQFHQTNQMKGVEVKVLSSAVTGYGEDLIKSAIDVDYGIVETMAHLTGAQFADPEVSFVLDIGGQDIKSIFIEKGVISNIELNEACSAGCGSFLQNFASTMNLNISEFANLACRSEYPCDLGSRCTVFMNSKVKQSLRENAGVEDIAAGLAYSVVKNCLFKVLKISNLNRLGDHIVVQGGTFRNEAVYRALEMLSGKTVTSTDYPELMGAFGAALYSRQQFIMDDKPAREFNFAVFDSLIENVQTTELRCKGCTNACSILRFKFGNGNISYAGNKCEKIFFSSGKVRTKGYNAFEEKNNITFTPIKTEKSPHRGRVGIPRILNLFENYPFWNALFTGLGFEVVLSPESTYSLYQKGVSTVMSDNICFPAKLAHGHIIALAEMGVDRIFYPIIPKEEKEFGKSNNSYNCPVVSGYPDVIRSSIDPEQKYGLIYDTPIIGFNDEQVLRKSCWRYFQSLGVEKKAFTMAFNKALRYKMKIKNELVSMQKQLFDKAVKENRSVFVIAGRPYHADPLIHQKTGQILADLGAYVFTDDVFRDEYEEKYASLNVVSQWTYPNRVLQSAMKIADMPANVQMVQLNSFGCGPDSFFMDEATNILKEAGKNLTIVRIDEIASPGSIRLRLRSLVESLKARQDSEVVKRYYRGYSTAFTKKDQQKTILIPWLCDFLSPMVPAIGELLGYKLVNLPKSSRASVDTGLKYGHPEVCYPSTLVLGDIINGLQSGNYDLDNMAVAITQTGGQCRATNYIAQIKTGLAQAGYSHIPIVALTGGKTYQNDQRGFKIPWMKLANIAAFIVLYGDALQQMYNAVKPRERKRGETKALFDFYMEQGSEAIRRNDHTVFLNLLKQAVADFNTIPVYEREFTKIGLVGEIFVKYNNYAQAYISDWLSDNGMEVVTPPILDFVMQYFVNSTVNYEHGLQRGSRFREMIKPLLWKYMNKRIVQTEVIMKDFKYYHPAESIYVKAEYASEILSLTNQFGEGWSVAAEVACYARTGIDRVVCIQPFGCIANHVVAKGIEKRLKKFYPQMNLLYLDVDGGVGEVNLRNRLHFMM